jgi:hypothetical protein
MGTALCGATVLAIGALQLLMLNGVGTLVQSLGIRPEHVTPLPSGMLLSSLGLGVFAAARIRPSAPRSLGYTWAPHAATGLLVLSSIVLWQALVHLQLRDLTRLTRSAATVMNANLLREIHALASVLDVLAAQPIPEPDHALGARGGRFCSAPRRASCRVSRCAKLPVVRRIWMSSDRTEPRPASQDRLLLIAPRSSTSPSSLTCSSAPESVQRTSRAGQCAPR